MPSVCSISASCEERKRNLISVLFHLVSAPNLSEISDPYLETERARDLSVACVHGLGCRLNCLSDHSISIVIDSTTWSPLLYTSAQDDCRNRYIEVS